MTLLCHGSRLPGHNRTCEAAGHRARTPGRARNHAGGARRHRQPAVQRRPRGRRQPAARGGPAGGPLRRRACVQPAPPAGRARPAARGLAGVAPARAPPQAHRPERALPGGPGRPPQRDRDRAGKGARLRGRRGALRHEGHPGLCRRKRRRIRHGCGGRAARTSGGPPHRAVRLLRREESPRGMPDDDSRKRGCAAARSPPRGSRTPGRWCCSTSSATGGSRSARGELQPGPVGEAACGGRRVGALEVFPSRRQGPGSDDHIPFLDQGVPVIDLIDFNFPSGIGAATTCRPCPSGASTPSARRSMSC